MTESAIRQQAAGKPLSGKYPHLKMGNQLADSLAPNPRTSMDFKKSPLIPPTWDIPHEIHERLGDRVGRQRTMSADGHLLVILHAPPQPDEFRRRERLFWRDPSGSWRSTEQGGGISALEEHLSQYNKILEECDRREDAATTAEDYFEVLERIAPVKRSTANLYQTLEDARQAYPEERELINLRDLAYEISRTAELMYDGSKNAFDLAHARSAEEHARIGHEMAAAAHRLNRLASFFFPLATLTAIFGMQLSTGWEHEYAPWPFLLVLAIGIMSGAMLSSFVVPPTPQLPSKRKPSSSTTRRSNSR